MTEYTAGISAVCLPVRPSLRHYWCAFAPPWPTNPSAGPDRCRSPLPSASAARDNLAKIPYAMEATTTTTTPRHPKPSNTTTDPCSPVVSEEYMSSCYLVSMSTCPAWVAAPRQLLAACSCFACIVVSCFWAAAAVLLTRSAHAHIPSHALRRYKQGTANCQTMGTLLDVQQQQQHVVARLLLSKSVAEYRHDNNAAWELSFSLQASQRGGEWEQNFPFPRPAVTALPRRDSYNAEVGR